MIKKAQERLILISPYLKFNDRVKELLADKDRMKIDVRIVYGKTELAPQEMNWLRSMEFVRTFFCQNLHAKCYLNEQAAIITSMNLYEFSQINNNEMGVYIQRDVDPELYRDTYEEALRLIRVSETVQFDGTDGEEPDSSDAVRDEQGYDKLTTSKLARERGLRTGELVELLIAKSWLTKDGDKVRLTDEGKRAGGQFMFSKKHGPYFLWPKDIQL
nr:phospholipase D family protein [Symbiobacterium terraclitae]